MDGTHTLPKRERLQHCYQFRQAYEQGRKLTGRFLVLYAVKNPSVSGALGVVTSRKIGGAVKRNRARRLLRESYRLHKNKLKDGLQIVMVARSAIDGKAFAEVENDVLRVFGTAGILK